MDLNHILLILFFPAVSGFTGLFMVARSTIQVAKPAITGGLRGSIQVASAMKKPIGIVPQLTKDVVQVAVPRKPILPVQERILLKPAATVVEAQPAFALAKPTLESSTILQNPAIPVKPILQDAIRTPGQLVPIRPNVPSLPSSQLNAPNIQNYRILAGQQGRLPNFRPADLKSQWSHAVSNQSPLSAISSGRYLLRKEDNNSKLGNDPGTSSTTEEPAMSGKTSQFAEETMDHSHFPTPEPAPHSSVPAPTWDIYRILGLVVVVVSLVMSLTFCLCSSKCVKTRFSIDC